MLHVWEFCDHRISRENVWLDARRDPRSTRGAQGGGAAWVPIACGPRCLERPLELEPSGSETARSHALSALPLGSGGSSTRSAAKTRIEITSALA
jgi:hypothetical protein